MNSIHSHASAPRTYLWIGVMIAIVLIKGFFTYLVVSNRGQPTWDYRTIRDVPAQSPYAVYPPLPHPQHIRGLKGE